VRLGPLPLDLVAQIVRSRIAQSTYADAPSLEMIELAVRLCGGSPGLALRLCADESLPAAITLTKAAIEAVARGASAIFGGDRSPLWSAWTEATAGPATGRPARERAACGRIADLWLLHLRERLRGGDGLPGLPALDRDPSHLVAQLDRLITLQQSLVRNPNARLALEHTLLELHD
jgi:DNA polymerase-3 subunit delta'